MLLIYDQCHYRMCEIHRETCINRRRMYLPTFSNISDVSRTYPSATTLLSTKSPYENKCFIKMSFLKLYKKKSSGEKFGERGGYATNSPRPF